MNKIIIGVEVTMVEETKLVRFDWAIKNILRDKANYDVLEGFLTALLKEDIRILNILESESNNQEGQKFNRVDLLVEDSKSRKIIIEIQNQRETDYIERILWGTSKTVVESVALGEEFEDIAKVISLSILYFNLGTGDDYIYYGNTEFRGVHTGNPLIVREKVKVPGEPEKIMYPIKANIFPEYYLIKIDKFNNNIVEDIDEWIYFLKNSEIKDEFKSKNIKKAKEKLDIIKMKKEERKRYEKYLVNIVSELDIMETAKEEGRQEGRQEGIDIGTEKAIEQLILKQHSKGLSVEYIADINELSIEYVRMMLIKKEQQ